MAGKLTGLKSNALIGMASQHMEQYRFSEEEAREVGMIPADTGVIILIILYFIEHEPNINRSKLEYYLLLLDRKCFEQQGVLLFLWYLEYGRVQNFKKFIDFMISKNLIALKNKKYFELLEAGKALSMLYTDLNDIEHWLQDILHDFGHKNAKQIVATTLFKKPTKQYLIAINNMEKFLDTRELLTISNKIQEKGYMPASEAAEVIGIQEAEVFEMCYPFLKEKNNTRFVPVACIDVWRYERTHLGTIYTDFSEKATPTQIINGQRHIFNMVATDRTREKFQKLARLLSSATKDTEAQSL